MLPTYLHKQLLVEGSLAQPLPLLEQQSRRMQELGSGKGTGAEGINLLRQGVELDGAIRQLILQDLPGCRCFGEVEGEKRVSPLLLVVCLRHQGIRSLCSQEAELLVLPRQTLVVKEAFLEGRNIGLRLLKLYFRTEEVLSRSSMATEKRKSTRLKPDGR